MVKRFGCLDNLVIFLTTNTVLEVNAHRLCSTSKIKKAKREEDEIEEEIGEEWKQEMRDVAGNLQVTLD